MIILQGRVAVDAFGQAIKLTYYHTRGLCSRRVPLSLLVKSRIYSRAAFSSESWYTAAQGDSQMASGYDGLPENAYEVSRTIFRSRHKFAGV